MPCSLRRALAGASFVVSALVCATLSGQAQPREVRKAVGAMQSIIEAHVESHDKAGLSIALVDAKGTAWSGQFGLADRELKAPVSPATVFELGSISKVFTCIAVMQLREQKKLDLDKPYVAYVPEFAVKSTFPGGGGAITARMLMTHQSGIVTDDDAWETTHPERYFHRAVLEHVKETALLFPPGQGWNYSSFGTSLLGVLVERISGMDFAEYMKKHVLQPLGMPGASFDFRDLEPARLSAAYHYHPAYDQIPKDEIRPGGSLRAPIDEAAHLLTMVNQDGEYQGRRILGTESVEEMTRLQDGGNKANPMGLGFRLRVSNVEGAGPVTCLYHDGVARNRSLFVFVPAWKAGFILGLNDHQKCDMLLWELKEAFLRELAAK